MIEKLREGRYTYQEIGDIFGISRQRVHQIITGYKSPRKRIPKHLHKINHYNSEGIRKTGREFLKEVVRKRDNWTCQICGKKWEEGERSLDVHHLDEELEGKNGLKYESCKNIDRMITLCHRCHLGLESVRNKMKRDRKKLST